MIITLPRDIIGEQLNNIIRCMWFESAEVSKDYRSPNVKRVLSLSRVAFDSRAISIDIEKHRSASNRSRLSGTPVGGMENGHQLQTAFEQIRVLNQMMIKEKRLIKDHRLKITMIMQPPFC